MNEDIVYFILDVQSNAVKIGYTTLKGLKRRLDNLQIGTPNNLKILGAVWGDRKIERKLHEKFVDFHIRGEWFNYTSEIDEYLNECWDFPLIESLEKKLFKKITTSNNYGR
jgi:hypothetical protein